MKQLYYKLFPLLLCLSAVTQQLNAQTEYLGTVNQTDGTFTKLFKLPGVKWVNTLPAFTTFDNVNQRFIFRGGPDQVDFHLYSVDVNTGAIVSDPSFPVVSNTQDNVIELQFDNSTQTLYGLHWNQSDDAEYFVKVNPQNGTHEIISYLPGVRFIAVSPNYTALDEVNQRFYFRGVSPNSSKLYTVDLASGEILAQPTFPIVANQADVLGELQFDNGLNTLFALFWDDAEQTQYLVSVDPMTGEYTKLHDIPDIKWITGNLQHYTTLDEVNHRLIFRGGDSFGNWYLFTLDLVSGQAIANPYFPIVDDPEDNVLELQYDNTGGVLYALHWDAHDDAVEATDDLSNNNAAFGLSPNPCTARTTIQLDQSYADIMVFVYNSTGQVVARQVAANSASLDLSCQELSKGTYFVSVIGNHHQIGLRKLVVE